MNCKLILLSIILTFSIAVLYSQNEFVYEDCGCGGSINLKIHNGLYGDYGGQEIQDADETLKGAVTVANLNDTDGDGNVDNIDNNVSPEMFPPTGRDEVDLMKLIVEKNGDFPNTQQCKSVKLNLSGNIELWESSTKGSIAPREFQINELPKTIWIEAIDVSSSVRDISVEAEMDGDIKDKINATAIWVQKNNVYKERVTTPDPSTSPNADLEIDKNIMIHLMAVQSDALDNTWYGFGDFFKEQISVNGVLMQHDIALGGRILFEYKILPSGVESELNDLGIKFDITRRKDRSHTYLTYTLSSVQTNPENFPTQKEEPNDDDGSDDEDVIPLTNSNLIYSYDTPSDWTIGSETDNAFSVKKFDFEEFVRVSFGIDIISTNYMIAGSRSSNKDLWSIDYAVGAFGNLNPNDPYDKNNMDLTLITSPGVYISQPKRLTGSGNGNISLSNVQSSSIVTYFLEYSSSGDQWHLRENGTVNDPILASSNTSTSGPWTISYLTVDVLIENNGSNSFMPGDIFAFAIWDVPSSTNMLIAN